MKFKAYYLIAIAWYASLLLPFWWSFILPGPTLGILIADLTLSLLWMWLFYFLRNRDAAKMRGETPLRGVAAIRAYSELHFTQLAVFAVAVAYIFATRPEESPIALGENAYIVCAAVITVICLIGIYVKRKAALEDEDEDEDED